MQMIVAKIRGEERLTWKDKCVNVDPLRRITLTGERVVYSHGLVYYSYNSTCEYSCYADGFVFGAISCIFFIPSTEMIHNYYFSP